MGAFSVQTQEWFITPKFLILLHVFLSFQPYFSLCITMSPSNISRYWLLMVSLILLPPQPSPSSLSPSYGTFSDCFLIHLSGQDPFSWKEWDKRQVIDNSCSITKFRRKRTLVYKGFSFYKTTYSGQHWHMWPLTKNLRLFVRAAHEFVKETMKMLYFNSCYFPCCAFKKLDNPVKGEKATICQVHIE